MARPARLTATEQLREMGQSVWLDYIRRGLIGSGQLARMVADGWVTGMTSNPTIFEKAIAGSTDYDASLSVIAAAGRVDSYDAFVTLAIDDIRSAADVLRPVYDETNAHDGYVSLEVPPGIESDVSRTVAEARRLFALANRPNVMIKIPGTPEGAKGLEECIAAGVNVNMTLLFAIDAYERAAEAYMTGLERRLAAGLPLDGIASVASFFVSRLDTAVDAQLPTGSPLRGKAAVANARAAYGRFIELTASERWSRLAAAGAQPQRPLWASTGTKDPAYSDVLYVEELVAPNTVNTMPEPTLRAVLDHARVRATIVPNLDDADRVRAGLRAAGIDLRTVTDTLLVEGLAAFERDFTRLLARLGSTLALLRVGYPAPVASVGPLAPAVAARLDELRRERIVERIFEGDHTVWKPDPTEITNRLGWIPVVETMAGQVEALRAFANTVVDDGYRTVVLLGMGGSSLAPEVLHATFGTAPGMLDLKVLDTTVPEQILDVERSLDLTTTLFIVASKSGGTIETLSHFAYFWDKIPDGAHFVAITDPGSSLEALAREHGFRRVFGNPPEIGGRYSALSYFGLVPAALIGVDVAELLARAREMLRACHPSVPPSENPGAWLGAVMAEAALAGRDKLTLALPKPLATLGYWIEQLVAESTGKEGRGILPVEGESIGPRRVYGDDRLFVAIGDNPQLAELEDAGQPVVRLPYTDPYQLGAEFLRWELATAVAGQVLAVNPFDQPNVQEAKEATGRILAGEQVAATPDSLQSVLASVKPGDYIAITAYVNRNAENDEALANIRLALRARYRVATTAGFGPRFLHSTGQLHKGGPNDGVFIQVVTDAGPDVPIPGKDYTFGALNRAQALGDLAALKGHGRRVARVTMRELIESQAQWST
jgi:transaldolase/glucose-6-phosphate isomerase